MQKRGALDCDSRRKPHSRTCERKALLEHDSCVCTAHADCAVGAKYYLPVCRSWSWLGMHVNARSSNHDPNHVLDRYSKRLSERDSSPCEHSHYLLPSSQHVSIRKIIDIDRVWMLATLNPELSKLWLSYIHDHQRLLKTHSSVCQNCISEHLKGKHTQQFTKEQKFSYMQADKYIYFDISIKPLLQVHWPYTLDAILTFLIYLNQFTLKGSQSG